MEDGVFNLSWSCYLVKNAGLYVPSRLFFEHFNGLKRNLTLYNLDGFYSVLSVLREGCGSRNASIPESLYNAEQQIILSVFLFGVQRQRHQTTALHSICSEQITIIRPDRMERSRPDLFQRARKAIMIILKCNYLCLSCVILREGTQRNAEAF